MTMNQRVLKNFLWGQESISEIQNVPMTFYRCCIFQTTCSFAGMSDCSEVRNARFLPVDCVERLRFECDVPESSGYEWRKVQEFGSARVRLLL